MPVPPIDNPMASLPTPLTTLVGREREAADLKELLLRSDVRLVTLTGPGGVGKTRLALRVAELLRAANAFPDGVWFVGLASLREPELVLPTIARALGLRDEGADAVIDRLVVALRDRQTLLILDNVEHLLSAVAPLAHLLTACPGLSILATSRAVLRLSGEHDIEAPPLTLPDLARLPPLASLAETEAVRLFVERARAASADFALTAANALIVASICQRLDGLPLAIELAAARVGHLSLPSLFARLERRLPLLTGGPRDHPVRLQTMRNAIAWSHDLLAPTEQALFCRLAVFAGGFTLEAAEMVGVEAVAGEAALPGGDLLPSTPSPAKQETGSVHASHHAIPVLDLVSALVDHSLLRKVEQPDGEPRYLMLETVREYAGELLTASGEADLVRRRHGDYFLALAREADSRLRGRDQLRWSTILEREQNNLRTALAWSLETPGEDERALVLAEALTHYWYLHGHYREGRRWLELAITSAGDRTTIARQRATTALGMLALLLGADRTAERHLRESLERAHLLKDAEGEAGALHYLGALYLYHRGNTERARELLTKSVQGFRLIDHRWNLAMTLCTLGVADVLDRHPHAARPALETSRRLFEELGDSWGLGRVLINLGELERIEGRFANAQRLYEESLEYTRRLGSPSSVGTLLNNLGYMAWRQGDLPRAATHFARGLTVAREHGERRGAVHCLAGLAGMIGLLGQPAPATKLLGAAASYFAELEASMWPVDRDDHDQIVGAIRRRLGDGAFAAAWAAGLPLPPDEAIDEALTLAELLPKTEPEETPSSGGLTLREIEVLRLIVEGRSDREIAAALSISHRTVARHLTNIFAKLDVANRTTAATLAIRQGLV